MSSPSIPLGMQPRIPAAKVAASIPAAAKPVVTFTRTKPGGNRVNPTTEYSALLRTVRDAGLLRRARTYYYVMFASLVVALGGVAVGFVLLGDSWFQLIMAGVLGIILTQFAFLAHEASHRQVFESGKANDLAGRMLANLFVGISYSWWMNKHSRHHANPNILGKDPDIDRDVVSFTEDQAGETRGIYAWFTKRQGKFFFPILVLEGLNLHVHGFRTVFGRGKVDKRTIEIVMLVARIGAYVAVIFLMLPLGMAFAFIGVQLAVFGVYMGSSFAPNHIGMPILPRDSKVDFLRRQVLTSRNVSGGWFINWFMGGLNFQVEHHLFPNMARPHLRAAQVIAREYCDTHTILYTETTLPEAYATVVRYMNRVGLAAGRDGFQCPAASAYGR
ncbi:fatty acid desaturase family protein [Subtercola endophyticus]|uniref:fatty acid desaturase family protein n=1 Tax=Subtercola endophyticus TaxID=2895559 RepID=UPI001E4CDE29|nr:acyl-CoA desaturase [Subtercola endophyticus]UFS59244.1 acyl-CoA desaturase [Subtercola endophyticus]